jgi:uncharacterized protein
MVSAPSRRPATCEHLAVSGTEVAVVIAAVLFGATVKSITGMGLPLIAIPIISLVTSPTTAIAVIALPNAAQNLVLLVRHVDHRHGSVGLARLLGAGVVGAVIGTATLGVVPETFTLSALFLIVALYLVTAVRMPDLRVPEMSARRWSPAVGFLAGLFQGGVGISGPIVGTWHHALRLNRDVFVFSVTVVFAVTGLTQFVVLLATGKMSGRFTVSLLLALVVVATVPLGARLRDRLSGTSFDHLVLGLLVLSLIAIGVDLIS